MRRYSPAREIGQQALGLKHGRLICALLREEGVLSQNTRLLLRLADRLLKSYTPRNSHPA
jgi:hypothetical protein